MAEMGWLSPTALWHLAWLLPGLCLLFAWGAWRRRRRLAPLLGEEPHSLLAKTTLSPGRRRLRFLLFLLAAALTVVALARPYWGLRILPFSGSGRDIMIVLDVSRSMLADDLKPSRLEHAKWLLRELLAATPGDRYGIVAFAGDAFLQCPLTGDRNSLFLYLNELGPDSVPVGGTHIERALRTALDAFAAAEGGHRAILLVTDGDELSGDSQGVVEELARRRLPLLAVGLGDPAGSGLIPVTSPDGKSRTLLRDRQGELVVSRLNEAALRRLALATPEGLYLRSTVTDPGLGILRQRIQRLVPEQYASGQRQRPIERFPLPLAGAVALLLAFLAIGERRRLPGTQALPAILLAMAWAAPLPAQETMADEPFPPTAMTAADNADQAPAPSAPAPSLPPWREYNQALDMHREERLAEARTHYERAINAAQARPEVRARAWRNLGVAAHREARAALPEDPEAALRNLATAEEAYREALRSSAVPAEVARNQQLLLADRRRAEEIIRRLQDMRDRQREAAEQARDAHDAQQQANASPSPGKEQDARDQAEQAEQAIGQYRQTAEQAKQAKDVAAAGQAAEAVRQARQAQREDDGQAAEKHLAEAMQALGAGQEGDAQPPPNDGQPGGNADRPRDDGRQPPPQGGEDEALPDDPGDLAHAEKPEQDPGEIDPRQAAALLDLMAEQEKDLREALRERRRRDAMLKPVDKDW